MLFTRGGSALCSHSIELLMFKTALSQARLGRVRAEGKPMSGKTTLILASRVFISAVLWGQQAATSSGDQPPSLKVTVKVMNVPATVRDKHGKIISNLSKDDFLLEEDGHPQTVRYFARETDL